MTTNNIFGDLKCGTHIHTFVLIVYLKIHTISLHVYGIHHLWHPLFLEFLGTEKYDFDLKNIGAHVHQIFTVELVIAIFIFTTHGKTLRAETLEIIIILIIIITNRKQAFRPPPLVPKQLGS
jgi:hypothetical protein